MQGADHVREPRAGDLAHLPLAEAAGARSRRAGCRPVPALPRRGEPSATSARSCPTSASPGASRARRRCCCPRPVRTRASTSWSAASPSASWPSRPTAGASARRRRRTPSRPARSRSSRCAPSRPRDPGDGQPSVPATDGGDARRSHGRRRSPFRAHLLVWWERPDADRAARTTRSSHRRRMHAAPSRDPVHDARGRARGDGHGARRDLVRRRDQPADEGRTHLAPGLPPFDRSRTPAVVGTRSPTGSAGSVSSA